MRGHTPASFEESQNSCCPPVRKSGSTEHTHTKQTRSNAGRSAETVEEIQTVPICSNPSVSFHNKRPHSIRFFPSSLRTFGSVKVTVKRPDLWRYNIRLILWKSTWCLFLNFNLRSTFHMFYPLHFFFWSQAPGKCFKMRPERAVKRGLLLSVLWLGFNGAWKIHVIIKNNSPSHWRQLSQGVNLPRQIERNPAICIVFYLMFFFLLCRFRGANLCIFRASLRICISLKAEYTAQYTI